LYVHRWDDETSTYETMKTLNIFVESGKVRYLGASTLRPDAWKISRANEMAYHHGWEPFSVLQPRYNLVDRETEGDYLEMAADRELAVCPWSPLEQGFLTRKYIREGGSSGESRAAKSSNFRDGYLS
jgi:aryl-alcohol dehydrogenase-like predicted oxidoreductase